MLPPRRHYFVFFSPCTFRSLERGDVSPNTKYVNNRTLLIRNRMVQWRRASITAYVYTSNKFETWLFIWRIYNIMFGLLDANAGIYQIEMYF